MHHQEAGNLERSNQWSPHFWDKLHNSLVASVGSIAGNTASHCKNSAAWQAGVHRSRNCHCSAACSRIAIGKTLAECSRPTAMLLPLQQNKVLHVS